MMEAPIAGAGRGAKPTGTASAPAPRARANTRAPGTTASRWWASTRGPVATPTKATGPKARGTGWESRPKDGGFTEESGPMALRDGTAPGRA